jgi:hypothetical protein
VTKCNDKLYCHITTLSKNNSNTAKQLNIAKEKLGRKFKCHCEQTVQVGFSFLFTVWSAWLISKPASMSKNFKNNNIF